MRYIRAPMIMRRTMLRMCKVGIAMPIVIKRTLWTRRSTVERGLIIIAVFEIIIAITLGVIFSKVRKSAKKAPTDVCLSSGCIQTASKILDKIDLKAEPCDDFFKFACGNFLKTIVIPDDHAYVDSFTLINNKLKEQLRIIIEEKSQPNEPKPFRLVRNIYKACMNRTSIERKGLKPLLERLKSLGGWPVLEGEKWQDENFDWKQSVFKFRKMGYSQNFFFELGVEIDSKDTNKRVIHIDQSSLGLNREYLIKGFSDKIVDAYYRYMLDIAAILGADKIRAVKELKESLDFEIKLANISLPREKRRNPNELYNPMTIKQLSENYLSIPWKDYINTIIKPAAEVNMDEKVIVQVPSFFTQFEILMAQTPKRIQANYVMWRAVADSVSRLSDDLRRRQMDYISKRSGKVEREARWKECIDFTSDRLSHSISALYIRKYFNEDKRMAANKMVHDIRHAFQKILKTIDWMDKKTKKKALDKAKSITSHIGYPSELLDDKKLEEFYEKLEIKEGDYFQSALNLTLFHTNKSFQRLKEPVNKSDWVDHSLSAVVNAFYNANENSILFPAGILQGVFFNNERPKYMNYGSIGHVIGHEITHGFDDQGRQYDKDGNLVDWWESTTSKKFLSKAECVINQYGNYTAEDTGLNLNGINTQGENIADMGGIRISYLAYQEWAKQNGPEPSLPGLDYSPSQLFWISVGNTWCIKQRPEVLKLIITTGVHSPGQFRVLGPLSNMPEFAKDFKCPVGSKMNPQKKCSVW